MRLHHLSVSAFGPFAGTEHVDFDELNDAGLFLLTGQTGAGKSSLLDAVCFALYGTVPGDRGVKALKSQHAAADARPEVVLDLTLQGRRFVVRRSPEWTRPKRRGDGVVTEKASASLLETTSGDEHLLTSRAAEVGHTLSLMMGMSAGQFMQVALLPQGGFQTFLRASSQERHEVLQQLFRTDRFTRIEHWVDDHGRLLRGRAAAGEAEVRRLVQTVADRSGADLPDDLDEEALPEAAAAGRVVSWADGLLAEAEATTVSLRTVHDEAGRKLASARRRHDDAVRRAQRRARVDAARRALADLAEGDAAAERDRIRLGAHDRALRCGPVLDLLHSAQSTLTGATSRRDEVVRGLTVLTGAADGGSAASLADRLCETRTALTRLETLLPREQEAEALRREAHGLRARLDEVELDLVASQARVGELPGRIDACTAALSDAAAQAARGEAVTLALVAARSRRDAAVELEEIEPRLVEAEDARRDARDRMQDAREEAQELANRRLAGMAAELAGALAEGAPCQVCGSTDHPHPATAAPDAVTEADQRAADRLLRDRAAEHDVAEEAVRSLRSRLDTVRAGCEGVAVEEAAATVDALEAELAVVSVAEQRADRLRQERILLAAEHSELSARHAGVLSDSAALREAVTRAERALSAETTRLRDGLGGEPGPVADAVSRTARLVDRLEQTRKALAELEAARDRVEELERQAGATASEHGFATLADVERASLTDHERERIEADLRERDEAATRAHAVLDEAAAEQPPGSWVDRAADPAFHDASRDDASRDEATRDEATRDDACDVDAFRRALEAAETATAQVAGELALAEDRLHVLHRRRRQLGVALESWAPLRDEAMRAESLSRLVRGLGHDNQLQMRLSAYVLATRLDQVVAAANERLVAMRDQRYLLQRTGRAERKGARAGLGLEVVDQWTGDVRAPTTLSGGETFVVSLALALGLADVVTHEAGGTEVETLFVDEGFGTLDADTLDDVMDRLDSLRSGGRTVGVVSHVTELQSRIPTQVRVEKGRSGSSVAVRTLVG